MLLQPPGQYDNGNNIDNGDNPPQLGVLSLLCAGRRLQNVWIVLLCRYNPVGKTFILLVSVGFLKLSEDRPLILFTVPQLASGWPRISV